MTETSKQVDSQYVFDRMCEGSNWNQRTDKPSLDCTLSEYENFYWLDRYDLEWVAFEWRVSYREFGPESSMRSICEYIASEARLPEVTCNEGDLFDCWPAAVFRSLKTELEQSNEIVDVAPSTPLTSIPSRQLVQALRRLRLANPKHVDFGRVQSKLRFKMPLWNLLKSFGVGIVFMMLAPLLLFSCDFGEEEGERNDRSVLPVVGCSLFYMLLIYVSGWKSIGIFLFAAVLFGLMGVHQQLRQPRYLSRLIFGNAVTIKELCRLIAANS
ncbi:MAG: hypothetical protein R3C11_15485 [Planctomycetaceae bacterium]